MNHSFNIEKENKILKTSSIQVKDTSLGSNGFKERYSIKYAYLSGSMYRGIASANLVISMVKSGFMSYFGSGGISIQ